MGRYGYWVVDGDGHVAEPESLWARHLPAKYQDAAPRVVTDNRGVKRVLIDGWFWTTPPGPGVGHPGGYVGGPRVDTYSGGSDPHARLADMDAEGIDVAVLFATVAMGPSAGMLPSGDVEFEAALCAAYNSWVAEYASADRGRLRPVAVLPTRNVPAAVTELHRAVERLGFVGAELPTNSVGVRYPGDPSFDPIYEAAQALGVPVFIHPHAGGQIAYVGRERFRNFFHGHMIAFPFEQMIAAMHVVTEGVLERFPRLRMGYPVSAGCPTGSSGWTSTGRSSRTWCPRCGVRPATGRRTRASCSPAIPTRTRCRSRSSSSATRRSCTRPIIRTGTR